MNTSSSVNSARETIRGGRTITVKRYAPTHDQALGSETEEELFIRKVPFLDADTILLTAWGTPRKELLAYTGKSKEYVESLTDESQIEVVKVGRELNFFMLQECFRLQAQTLEGQGQSGVVKEAMEKALAEIMKDQNRSQ